jgi:hypothetical protein
MTSVQSSIRAEISHRASPVPTTGAEVFVAYAIASAKNLSPEVENAARLTLDHPMTFEILGEGLRLFDCSALRDLVNYRKRCRDRLVACLKLYLKVPNNSPKPSFWFRCPEVMSWSSRQNRLFPRWLTELVLRNQNDLKLQVFTHPLDVHSRIRQEYSTALQNHKDCKDCSRVHIREGFTFCAELENELLQARGEVIYSLYFSSIKRLTCGYPVIAAVT